MVLTGQDLTAHADDVVIMMVVEVISEGLLANQKGCVRSLVFPVCLWQRQANLRQRVQAALPALFVYHKNPNKIVRLPL